MRSIQQLCAISVAILSMAIGSVANAEERQIETQRIVTGVKFLRTSASSTILLGWGIKQFQSESFYVGGIAYTGATASGQLGNYSEGGLMLGFNSPAFGSFEVDVNLTLGAGGGIIQSGATNTSAGGLIINPAIGLDASLGKTFKMGLYVGYDFMPNSSTFTGFTVQGLVSFLKF